MDGSLGSLLDTLLLGRNLEKNLYCLYLLQSMMFGLSTCNAALILL